MDAVAVLIMTITLYTLVVTSSSRRRWETSTQKSTSSSF